MSNTPNLNIELLEPNSAQPEVPVNAATLALDAKITGKVALTVTNSGVVAVTQDEQAAGSIFVLTAASPGPTGPCTVDFAAFGMGICSFENDLGFPVTLQISGQPLAGPVFDAGTIGLFQSDGVNVQGLGGTSSTSAGIVLAMTASETLAAGDMVNVWNSSGAKIRKANATDDTKQCHGFVKSAVANGAVGIFYGPGQLNSSRSGLTPGATYYLDTTGGAVVNPPTSAGGNLVQELGFALSATKLAFSPKASVVL